MTLWLLRGQDVCCGEYIIIIKSNCDGLCLCSFHYISIFKNPYSHDDFLF